MPIFFNVLGLIMVLIGGIIGLILQGIIGANDSIIVTGASVCIIDFLYRTSRKNPLEKTPLFSPNRGGQIMFLPIWLWGVIFFIVGISF